MLPEVPKDKNNKDARNGHLKVKLKMLLKANDE